MTLVGVKRWCRAALILVTSWMIFAGPMRAQDGRTGAITGRIADSLGNTLPGATIRVLGSALVASADRDGRFRVGDVLPGPHSIVATYIGFRPDTQAVTVPAGSAASVDITMRRRAVSLPEVTVTAARARGEVQALTEQKDADNIVNVLPAEIITSLPNTNVADAVGRLPGVTLERDEGEGKYIQVRGTDPRLTNVTVDGVHLPSPEGGVRNIKLDVIPSDIIGTIELNKTLSPDQDADAIGGSVNLVTKTPGDRPFATALAQGGYTHLQGGRTLYQFGGTTGGRFGSAKRLGVIVGGTFDWNGRGIDDIEPGPGTNDFGDGRGPVPVVTAVDYREYRYNRSRLGLAGGLDYRLGASSSLYLHGLFANFWNYGQRWVTSPAAGNFITPTTTDNAGSVVRSVQNRTPNEQIYSIVAGGAHALSGVTLDYEASFARARQNRYQQRTTEYAGPSNVAYTIGTSDPNFPTFSVANGVNLDDPNTFVLDNSQLTNEHAADRAIGGAVNLTVPYRLSSGWRSAFKFGGKIRDEHKDQEAADSFYSASGAPTISLSQVMGSFANPGYYFDRFGGTGYVLGPVVDFDANNAMLAADPTALAFDVNKTHSQSDPNNFTVRERVYAAYAMNTLEIGRLRLQGGARLEATRAGYTGKLVTLDGSGTWISTSPTSGTQNYTNVLPMIQLRYALSDNSNVRAAYGRGISRPNFGDLVPFRVVDDKGGQIDIGNPALKPTRSNNFDVLLEHYFASVGVASGGFFYKHLTDPIYEGVETPITSGPDAGFTQSQPINGSSAYVWGIELGWQQHLSFLPGALSGLGIISNYAYTYSRAAVPGRSDRPALERQAPETWNLGLTYDRAGFSARVAATHNGASIFAYKYQDGADGGVTGPNGDNYLYPRTQLDAQASYRLPRGIEVFAQMLNITNEVFGFYNGSAQFPNQREFYGWSTFLGLRLAR